jgi:hypothetical protein
VASGAIVDQLTPLLPKDGEQVVGKLKQLHALLEAVTPTNPGFVQEVGKRGQEINHHRYHGSQSSRKGSTSSFSSSRGQRDQGHDERDLRNFIQSKDMRSQIECHRQDMDRVD